jgi:phosphopentomutase
MSKTSRAVIIVLDSLGAGELPDAFRFGDQGSNTLGNMARAVGGLRLPNLEAFGLGKIIPIEGVRDDVTAKAFHGKITPTVSPGKLSNSLPGPSAGPCWATSPPPAPK